MLVQRLPRAAVRPDPSTSRILLCCTMQPVGCTDGAGSSLRLWRALDGPSAARLAGRVARRHAIFLDSELPEMLEGP